MMIVTGIPHIDGLKPRGFGSLMDIYENNFILLRKLIPGMTAWRGGAVSHVTGATDLHMLVLESCPYTTTLQLTYYFNADGESDPNPDLIVRVYHDAQVAEVMSCRRWERRKSALAGRGEFAAMLEDRWRLNRFLLKWLGFCLHQGHGFPRAITPPR